MESVLDKPLPAPGTLLKRAHTLFFGFLSFICPNWQTLPGELGLRSSVLGTILLFKFYWRHFPTLQSLPKELINPVRTLGCHYYMPVLQQGALLLYIMCQYFGACVMEASQGLGARVMEACVLMCQDMMEQRLASQGTFEITVGTAARIAYERDLSDVKEQLRRLSPQGSLPFPTKMGLFFVLRLLCVTSALMLPVGWTVFFCTLQFVILPYSFFVSFAQLLVLGPALFVGHFAAQVPLQFLCATLLPAALQLHITITPAFIVLFFLADQLACWACVWRTPQGPTAPITTQRLLQSIMFGFLNCKTYFLILLLHLQGLEIFLLPWLLDAQFKFSGRAGQWLARKTLHWSALFYHQHRVSHSPFVYQDAHKFHHYLHDTTAFDAHIYGSGAPEEILCLFTELLPAVALGIMPPSLSFNVLSISWDNKVAHTRKAGDSDSEAGEAAANNWHADHHVLHSKNYGGFNAALDMYMGTASNNTTHAIGPHHQLTVQPHADGDSVVLAFTPRAVQYSQVNLGRVVSAVGCGGGRRWATSLQNLAQGLRGLQAGLGQARVEMDLLVSIVMAGASWGFSADLESIRIIFL